MNIIAKSKNIEIYAEKGWEFSFFASPYVAHREFKAVDIYQGREFGETALSPVSGRVFKVMRFDSPSPTSRSLPEYLILVQDGDYLVRIMHVEPLVREGEWIHVGDEFGRFIRNGYFFHWVDAGMHIEIRDLGGYLRSRGGYELTPTFKGEITVENRLPLELKGEVVDVNKRNITVGLNRDNINTVKVGDEYTVMDAASSIGYGGVLGRFRVGEVVYFNGIGIGKINKVGTYMSTFEMENLRVFANGVEFRGISSMFGRPVIRLLPEEYGEPVFNKGETVEIEIKREKKGGRR